MGGVGCTKKGAGARRGGGGGRAPSELNPLLPNKRDSSAFRSLHDPEAEPASFSTTVCDSQPSNRSPKLSSQEATPSKARDAHAKQRQGRCHTTRPPPEPARTFLTRTQQSHHGGRQAHLGLQQEVRQHHAQRLGLKPRTKARALHRDREEEGTRGREREERPLRPQSGHKSSARSAPPPQRSDLERQDTPGQAGSLP